ncbi:MAG: cache domain-containing protein [Roseiflexaceae bacterium]|nr:cache domain-containing protein [Roseiflexaceae bacterium]
MRNAKGQDHRSLTATLALALITLSVTALGITGILQLISHIQTQENSIAQLQRMIAQSAAKEVNIFLEERVKTLKVISQFNDLIDSPEARRRVTRGLIGIEKSFEHIIVLDAQNSILTHVTRLSLPSKAIYEQVDTHEIMRQIQQNGHYVGPIFIDRATNEPHILLAVPVTDPLGEHQGVLIGVVNLRFMWNLINTLDVGQSGYAYIIDRRGNLLAFRDIARVLRGDNVADIPAVREFMANTSSDTVRQVGSYIGLAGDQVVGAYVALGQPDWAVITEIPWSEAYSGVLRDVSWAMMIIAGTVVIAGFAGVALARRLTQPLMQLVHTANRIAEGERDLQAVVQGPYEIATMARAFNAMMSQLNSVLNELEQRIAQRTADLSAALAEVQARAREQARLLEENQRQRQAIRELSVPVLPVNDRVLVMPLIGAIDTDRLMNIQERALEALEQMSARYVLFDITGVPIIDSRVAQGLIAIARMVRLLGAEAVLIGVRPEVAQTIVGLGLDLGGLRTSANLQTILRSLA